MEDLDRVIASTYQPLPNDSSWIRLLHLQPATESEAPVQVNLTAVLLESAHPYEALSYCWGDAFITESVQVDDQSLSVTTNLAVALRALRLPSNSRVLWIDALCINQSNVREKNSQVGIMKDIYASASRTIVWLGPSDENSRRQFKKLSQKSKQSIREDWNEIRDMLAVRPRKATVDRPWVSRIWVVQELAYSRIATVYCGEDQCDWQDFTRIWHALGGSDILSPALNDQVMAMDMMKRRIVEGDRLELWEALRTFRGFDATRALDKVYAIVGLLQRPKDVLIDYDSDHRNVFRELTLSIMAQTRSLDVLGDALQRKQDTQLHGMMLWIVDWCDNDSLPPIDHKLHTVSTTPFSASGDTFAMPNLHLDGTLQVNAQFIDRVEEMGEFMPSLVEIFAQIWPQDHVFLRISAPIDIVSLVVDRFVIWFDVACRVNGPRGTPDDSYITGQSMLEAALFTLLKDDPPRATSSQYSLIVFCNSSNGSFI